MKVAAIQLCQGDTIDGNVDDAVSLVEEAAGEGAAFIALPEYFAGYAAEVEWRKIAGKGASILERLKKAARELRIHLLAGSILFPAPVAGKCLNVSVLIGPDGTEIARYQKKNLFDVQLASRRYCESDWIVPGGQAVVAPVEDWTAGFSICFDLRFPELYRDLRRMGAEIILAPSAFSYETGKDHWLTLLKARAIETQCYVIAPALEGENKAGHKCFGHTAIIDPWGDVVGLRERETGIVYARLDRERLIDVRRKVPMRW